MWRSASATARIGGTPEREASGPGLGDEHVSTQVTGLTAVEVRRDGAACVLAASGELSARSAAVLARELAKVLLDAGRVVLDVRGLRARWAPALQVIPSTLACVGGWPRARLVLFGASDELQAQLRELDIPDSVPVVGDVMSARDRLHRRPSRICRSLNLPLEPRAPRMSRVFVGAACEDWGVETVYDDAATVATELVANAVEHARTESRVVVTLDRQGLTVAVRDERPGEIVQLRTVDPSRRRGHGLVVVAGLSTTWGVTQHESGKTVWALLPVERRGGKAP